MLNKLAFLKQLVKTDDMTWHSLVIVTLSILIHTLILILVFQSGIYGTEGNPDINRYFNYSVSIAHGQLPYRDFMVEYPPLALAFFTLPYLVAPTLHMYQYVFSAQILFFDLLGLFLISAMSRRLGFHLASMLALYTLALLAIGPIIINRYDLIPAIMVLLSLYAFSQNKHKLSWVFLAVGMITKIYPVIIAPIFLLYYFHHRQYRHIVIGMSTFIITTAIIIAPWLVISPDGFWHCFGYHAERGLQLESTYSSFLLLGHTLGITSVHVEEILNVQTVTSPLADTLATISPLIMTLSAGVIYWVFYNGQRAKANIESPSSSITRSNIANITNYSFLVILTFMLSNKVFSPQFIIWLYPLIPLIAGQWRHSSWIVFLLVCVLTYYVFPQHYGGLIQGNFKMVAILLSRNILLIALACLLLDWKRLIPTYRG
jgi:uncharacterized membrane protein